MSAPDVNAAAMTDRDLILEAAKAYQMASEAAGAALLDAAVSNPAYMEALEVWKTFDGRGLALLNILAMRQQARKERAGDD